MEKVVISFAPVWLARVILEDEKSNDHVETFLRNIPTNLHGGLILKNETTGCEYRGADRYMPTIVFLASIWTMTTYRFSIFCEGTKRTQIDTRVLETLDPSEDFHKALLVGEKTWKQIEETKRAQREFDQNMEPRGHWCLVWADDET